MIITIILHCHPFFIIEITLPVSFTIVFTNDFMIEITLAIGFYYRNFIASEFHFRNQAMIFMKKNDIANDFLL